MLSFFDEKAAMNPLNGSREGKDQPLEEPPLPDASLAVVGDDEQARQRARMVLMKAIWTQQQARAAAVLHRQQQAHAAAQAASLPLLGQQHVLTHPTHEPSLQHHGISMQAPITAPQHPVEYYPSVPSASTLTGHNLFAEEDTFINPDHQQETTLMPDFASSMPQHAAHQSLKSSAPERNSLHTTDRERSTVKQVPSDASNQPSAPESCEGITVPPFLLHQACKLYADNEMIIQSTLRVDPSGIRRRLSDGAESNNEPSRPFSEYTYPINIALCQKATLGVLQLLADAGPDVLVEPDGRDLCCSLGCALTQKRDMDVVSMLLLANPDTVRVADRQANYPLHMACLYGSSLEVVKLLTSTYPSAVSKKNFHVQTPLDIAQRSRVCSDNVLDYLQQVAYGSLEENALHLD